LHTRHLRNPAISDSPAASSHRGTAFGPSCEIPPSLSPWPQLNPKRIAPFSPCKGCEERAGGYPDDLGFNPESGFGSFLCSKPPNHSTRGASTISRSKSNPKGEMPTIHVAVASTNLKFCHHRKSLCLKALPNIQSHCLRSGTRCATQPARHAKPTARVGEGMHQNAT